MSILNMIILLAATAFAVSFGWGMRGDLIGGEEGAMLPGTLLGMIICATIGVPFFENNFLLFAALGMAGMFIGGTEPYAQCFEFTYWGDGFNPKPKNLKKGLVGLMIKGAPWFGICAAVMSVGFTAFVTPIYKWYEIAILIIALPLMRFAGTRIINYPRDVKKKHLPKIYFSRTSPEEWGGLWFMMITLLAFIIYHKDSFALTITLLGMLGGSVGWVIAQLAQCFTMVRMKNGKYLFGSLQENGWIDNWKIMEFIYGALGGLSIAVGFLIERPTIMRYTASPDNGSAVWSPLENVFGFDISVIAPIAWIILFVFDMASHLVPAPEKIIKKSLYSRYRKIADFCHRPILCYIPMALILLGSRKTAYVYVIAVLIWEAAEEFTFVQLKKSDKGIVICKIVSYLSAFSLIAIAWFKPEIFSIISLFVIVSLVYIILASAGSVVQLKGVKSQLSKNEAVKALNSKGYIISVKICYIIFVILSVLFLKINCIIC